MPLLLTSLQAANNATQSMHREGGNPMDGSRILEREVWVMWPIVEYKTMHS